MLKTERSTFYRVKKGDDINKIAETFSVPPFLLAKINCLMDEVAVGQIITIPSAEGNLYTVRAGDTKEKLCGSKQKYEELNGTSAFFIGMKIFIP